MIPDKERKILIDNWVYTLLRRECVLKRYDVIEKLWNASGLTNKNLVEVLLSDKENPTPDFKESIFEDMIWLLKNAISENTAMRSLFSDIYAVRFPKVDKYIKTLEKRIINGGKVQVSMPDMMKFFKGNDCTDEAEYFVFRVYNSDVIVLNDCVDPRFWKKEYEFSLRNLIKESDYGDDDILFTDGSNCEVFKSKMFERFVKKQREALADYLKIEESRLAAFYDEALTIHEVPNEGWGFSASVFGLIPAAIMEMIWTHGGTGHWLVNIQSLNKKNELAYKYRPNFDVLFERYCRASVRIDYEDFMLKGAPFTPLTLARNCAFINMEALAISIGYVYLCDCVYQMYVQMQKQFYESFSWEGYRNIDLRDRYEGLIADLRSSLAVRDRELQELRTLYASLKRTLEKKNDLAILKELQEKDRLLDISKQKDLEIERLRGIIASQNQMIERLQVAEMDFDDATGKNPYDESNSPIYQHRYLFVGDITALGFDELRRKFPSSIFMESNTTNISHVQVDAVVFLIQAMSHSMYYKCKNTPALQDSKIIYYNGRGSIDSLLCTIEREIS